MPWLWTNKAPKCKAQLQGEMALASEEWARQVLRTAVNSSNQRPTFSHWHNIGLATSSSSNLLSIPANLRKEILRLAIVEPEPILVAADYPEECNEPGLLQVCHAIRGEARPMFYTENIFSVQIQDFDIKAVLPWVERTEEFHFGKNSPPEEQSLVEAEETDEQMTIEVKKEAAENLAGKTSYADTLMAIEGETNIAVPSRSIPTVHVTTAGVNVVSGTSHQRLLEFGVSQAQQVMMSNMGARHLASSLERQPAPAGSLYYDEPYQPHWSNLVAWLKLFHDGKVGRYEGNGADHELAVSGLFDVMECFKAKGFDWATIEDFLTGHRKMLAGTDGEWLVEH